MKTANRNLFFLGMVVWMFWGIFLYSCKSTLSVKASKNQDQSEVDNKKNKNNIAKNGQINNIEISPFLDSINSGFIKKGAFDLEEYYKKVDHIPDYVNSILPGVSFYTISKVTSSGVSKGFMMAYYNGIHYRPGEFNLLLNIVQGSNKIEIIEKLKCILFWAYQSNYELYGLEKKNGVLAQFNENYQYVAKCSKGILYIKYENDEFIEINLFQGDTFSSSWKYVNTSLR